MATLHVVVIGAPVVARRQERARRQCLEGLLFHLEDAGVGQVWLETRNPTADRRDVDAVNGFRARRVVTAKIRADHARPVAEPLLWAADIVAGAISAAEGAEPVYRALLAGVFTEHRIDLG